MSELSKLQKRLQEIEVQLSGINNEDPDSSDLPADEAVLATAELLLTGTVSDRCDAFSRKLTEEDPVSD
jgi:hypothetical protein